jgi:hypothetical protein
MTKEEIIKTNLINNKDIQSKKNVVTRESLFNITILQSTKKIKSFIIKQTTQKQQNHPNKNKSNKTDRHKSKTKLYHWHHKPIFYLNCLDPNLTNQPN